MQKQQILRNAVLSVLQIVIIGTVLFVLYRYLLNTIGIEQLGIWSLVIATTSVTQIANFGLSGSVVKFVAKYVALSEEHNVSSVVQTAAISMGVVIGFISLIGYPIIRWVLSLVLPVHSFPLALSILPFSLGAFWLVMISSIFQAGIDGYQRMDLKSILLMAGAIINLLLCYTLVPIYKLNGVVYAQIAQNLLILLSSWIFLKKNNPVLPILPYRWSRARFKEMLKYGMNFQMISITMMFNDPVTKALLSKFGGLTMTGYYEMASRMVVQIRALLVAANGVLVPTIAGLYEKNPGMIKKLYNDSYRLLFYMVFPICASVIAFTPVISKVWLGYYQNDFILFAVMLAVGWFLNTLVGPAYFANLGTGEVGWNTIGHVVQSLMNLALGLVLGLIFGGKGVVTAWILALLTGSFIILLSYHRRNGILLVELFPKEHFKIVIASVVAASLSLLMYTFLNNKSNSLTIAILVVFTIFSVIGSPVWHNPMRQKLTGWVMIGLSKGQIK